MKRILLSIFAVAALSLPTAALAGHGHHGQGGPHADCPLGAHKCDSKAACPLGHKDCENHKNCPLGKHDCGKGTANLDSNKDGKVSLKEFTAAHNDRMKKKFEYLDANGDGFLTDADSDLRKAKRIDDSFTAADTNKDGTLSKEEYAAAKQARYGKKKECKFSDKK
ncbi:EF hand [Mariprofundus aestuarium]|uniref:EF hand n=1 Tax=Mariprofundus aestuarium TaxID=1921086 RepID=A0A2K8KZM5_MARES|nr:EF-hand domain-containing protein [Mariprofundus aestuarium]ATX78991.1 EF hand [Mariprofundus aestuarium]